MTRSRPAPGIEPYLESLLNETHAAERDRIVLDAVFGLGLAGAAAIWKRIGRRDRREGGERRWRPTLSRGVADALPNDTIVSASLEGTLGFELDGACTILRGEDEAALVLAERSASQDELDALEGLLLVWGTLAADTETVEALAPLRPVSSTASRDIPAATSPTAASVLRDVCTRMRARGIDIELNIHTSLEQERSVLDAAVYDNTLAHLFTRAGASSLRVDWQPCPAAGGTLLSIAERPSRICTDASSAPLERDRGGFTSELERRVERAGGSLVATSSTGRGRKILLHLPAAS